MWELSGIVEAVISVSYVLNVKKGGGVHLYVFLS